LLAPVALGVVLLAAAVAAIVLATRGREDGPPDVGAFTPPVPAHPASAQDVQQVRGGVLTLAGAAGPVDVTPSAGIPVYLLQPSAIDAAAPGDWVTLVGISNEVLNFTIRHVLIIPAGAGAAPDADGIARLPFGLAGHEATRDPRERPILSGKVEAVSSRELTITVNGRTATVEASTSGIVRRLAPADLSAIREGDRVAFAPASQGADASTAKGFIVLR
jgi:hypothetical protein